MIVWCTLMLIFCKFANLPSVWQLMCGSRTKDASLGWQHTFKGDDDTSCISVDVKTASRDICKTCQVNLKHIPVLILFRGCDPLLFWRCSHMMRPERMSSSRPSAFFCHPSLPYTFMHATFILYAQKFPDMQNISRQQPWRTGGFFFLWPTGWPPGRVICFIAAPGVVLVSIFQLNNCWIQRDKSWYDRSVPTIEKYRFFHYFI